MRRTALLLCALAVLGASCSYRTRDVVPTIPVAAQSSTVYAADGTLLHTFHAEENRKNVPLAEIPRHLRDAVVAIEDERYYRHRGVDGRAVLRALRTNTEAGGIEQGGSTITQQYVKNVLLETDAQTIARKVEEASLALQLERNYTKERILELYLNTIYFGNGAYGVEAAARQYFGKAVGDVSLAEAALLAGLIQAPSRHDPYRAPDSALRRRALVIGRMLANGFITEDEAAWADATPIELDSAVVPAAEQYPAAYFVEEVKRWILRDERFGATPQARRDLLFGGGLRIQTTVDLRLQGLAEAAVTQVLPDPTSHPDAALVALEPATGFVRAMVGGRDFFGAGTAAKLNLATQGPRQAGSSFKPLVLAAALEQGISIDSVWSAPGSMTIPQPDGAPAWSVSNYGGGGGGAVTLAEATVRSYNTTFAQLIMAVGVEEAIEMAERLGIRTPLRPFPSAVLGANEVTAIDMAAAYATFANRGIRVPPVLVTRITRPDGTVFYEHRHTQERTLSVEVADTITNVLADAVARGTGTRAQIDRPVAGKTGTAQEWRDAWFAGFTPELSVAVWVGFEGAQISMQPPRTPIRVTGGSWPAEIWARFTGPALAGRLPTELPPMPTTTTTTAPAPAQVATSTTLGAPVPVPDVVGRTVAEATDVLVRAGFRVRRGPAPGAAGAPGTVAVQSPRSGGTAPAGTTVFLEVVGDGQSAIVPDVVGRSGSEARSALQAAGYEVRVQQASAPQPPAPEQLPDGEDPDGAAAPQPPPGPAPGEVWEQSPAGGSTAPRGSTVTIRVQPG
jgi:penicillin-binding protein 1A